MWYRYQKALGNTDYPNIVKHHLKRTFKAIKELDEDERQFVADKYYRERMKGDSILADEQGTSKGKIATYRYSVLNHLQQILDDQRED